eukprot:TRINITY_DN57626_c0_g1_i1.p1 TRINITY_DN57626_c0_g1~~TRINITY_DN57626_c0_g1_i1.p1  ORF type:complete len:120 (-),score=21.45 TRINITY_DN57626_c0_g1_i1:194-553(-)
MTKRKADEVGDETSKGAFVLLLTMQFEEEDHIKQFVKFFEPLAEYCKEHEPNTLSYEISLSDKDPLRLMLLERYRCKEDMIEVHQKSEPFALFKKQITEAGLKRKTEGHSYYETKAGYM